MTKFAMRKKLSTVRTRVSIAAASLLVACGMIVVTTPPPASAGIVPNWYECDPATGWCYQTNPPYNSSVPQSCRWNENVHNTWGMWYTGCDAGYWRPYVYA